MCWFWRSWWWTDDGFTGRRNNYIAYKSNGDRYGNLSPKKYLDIIQPYLRDWINNYKPTTGSNNEENDEENDSADKKIQLAMQNNFVFDKNFWRKYIGTLFNTISERIQKAIETSNERGSGFTHDSVALLYYYFQKMNIRICESYIMSPDWIVSKKATINPKNDKDNKCFQWAVISGLNYNRIKVKDLKNILKFEIVDT